MTEALTLTQNHLTPKLSSLELTSGASTILKSPSTDSKKFLPESSAPQKNDLSLDILRAIAIISVVHVHGNSLFPETLPFLRNSNFIVDGVSVFFVLSGFLIGRILLKTLSKGTFSCNDLFNFWIRRWVRTVPNYYFVLCLIVVLTILFQEDNLKNLSFEYFIFSQNLFCSHPYFYPEAWSLTIEEWFYLLFPAFVALSIYSTRNIKWSFLLIMVLFFVIPLLMRIIYFESSIGIDNLDANFRKIVFFR
jgi:peptidoglycan/LPS O-acetylase OafA/YrhL